MKISPNLWLLKAREWGDVLCVVDDIVVIGTPITMVCVPLTDFEHRQENVRSLAKYCPPLPDLVAVVERLRTLHQEKPNFVKPLHFQVTPVDWNSAEVLFEYDGNVYTRKELDKLDSLPNTHLMGTMEVCNAKAAAFAFEHGFGAVMAIWERELSGYLATEDSEA